MGVLMAILDNKQAACISIPQAICNISGIPDASLEFVEHGVTMYTASPCHAGFEGKRPFGNDSILVLGSLDQGTTAALVASFYDGGAISSSDTTMNMLLPVFYPENIIG
jgi:hypothetical protein